MQIAEVLIEALPYITAFQGKTFVIKYGGSVMENDVLRQHFIEDVALLKMVGINIVIVHGGGKKINEMLERMEVPVEFKQGLRVTNEETVRVVEMVLSGFVNKQLTGALNQMGVDAIGISGKDANLLTATKITSHIKNKEVDLGYVGRISSVNSYMLEDIIDAGYLPVISPVAADKTGQTYNVNADYAAGAIAGALNAEKFILLSDQKGLYTDINDETTFVSEIHIDQVKRFMEEGTITGGMIPKMECCMHAIEVGTKEVVLIDGRTPHSLLLEIFTVEGSGTMIKGGGK